ncbi:FecR family protein [Prosthecobacter fusiformis]|uniref:FecR family protein n=1 Tax=Prosthecobacter fusiformis TaxID=48464 RepID=A0A4R7RWM5_9BACT|nr:LamG-like jellyroll fold domain-containing protein [Prosthecobacter fusiformis]TDU69265.1 FecR family protein [Prosthecobacter fusiformis]
MSELSHDPEVLIQHYLEDRLTEDEAALLLELLQKPALGEADPLHEKLLHQLSMDAMLREVKAAASTSTGPVILPAAPSAKTKARFSFTTLTSVAAVAACITLALTWLFVFTRQLPSMADAEDTTAAVAVLSRGVNLEWQGESHTPGSPLSPGWLRLESGLAQIEFYQGARVTLEGPAAFRLVSSSQAYCTAGKLSVHVPPQAKGFRIDTPKGTIVDLGTDFGLDLNVPTAELHVFKGEVELHATGAAMKPLYEGQGMTLGDENQAFTANQAAFASLNTVDERTAESQRLAFESWLSSRPEWNNEASLQMRLDFQDPVGTRSLRNHAVKAPQVPAGSIVGCDWTEGRWPGKRALEFRNVSDRVRLSIPGEHEAITLCAWVRVHGLDRPFNSLFMAEGYADGAIHWQITRDGKLRLGIAGRDGHPSRDHDTPALFKPERFGQWMHLATVIDPVAKEIRHYLNGEEVARVPWLHVFPVRPGLADLGNWNDGGRSDRVAIRNFSGTMDEFMLFSRVLTEQEIAKLAR